ncbi:MAG: hypothetical protein ACK5KP_09885 [Paludibacteraceae bacterium]
MKKILIYCIILVFGTSSCSNKEFETDMPSASIDFLSNRPIIGIRAVDEDLWFLTSRPCDTCLVPLEVSYRPYLYQLSRQRGSEFRFDEDFVFSTPVKDQYGNLYTSKAHEILKINDIRDYTSVVKTGNFMIHQYVFDKNNHIWMIGNSGVAHWDGTKLTRYDASNSILPSNILHGIAVDQSGVVWIPLDLGYGILKITNGEWQIIPVSQIASLNESSYLRSPLVDKENRIWFTVFAGSASSNTILFDGDKWISDFPTLTKFGTLFLDSRGTIWRLNDYYSDSKRTHSTLQYLDSGKWVEFDIKYIADQILSLDVKDSRVYIGTVNGLIIR